MFCNDAEHLVRVGGMCGHHRLTVNVMLKLDEVYGPQLSIIWQARVWHHARASE